MEKWEKEIIRDLAKEKHEIANLPKMEELKKLWRLHNDLNEKRPMIHFEAWTVMDEGFQYQTKCQSPEAVAIERELGNSMTLNHKTAGTFKSSCRFSIFLFSYHKQSLPITKL